VEAVGAAITGAKTIYHLACLGLRHSLHDPSENHAVNATGALAVLLAARAQGVSRFVHVSSSEVYGSALTLPMSERHPTLPTTIYGAAKLAGEAYARAFHRAHGMAVTVVRPFNAFGPRCHHEGDAGEVIPKFLLRALAGRPLNVFGDGTQARDFTYVDDIAAGIRAAGDCDAAIGATINLGSGAPRTLLDVAAEVGRVVGRQITIHHRPPRPGDLALLCADAAQARGLIGWEPVVGFEEGLRRLLAWYRASGTPPDRLLKGEIEENWRLSSADER
jgi:UDP-glucose 4-epimerase